MLVLSKNTNELKTGAPGRFDRHRPMASPRSGACRRRCRRFGFPVLCQNSDSHDIPKRRPTAVLSKNTNELKTGAPGVSIVIAPVASHRSGACRRRCRRFGFSARAGKTPSSNGMPRSRAETWIQARAAPGPERASPLRQGSPGLDSGSLGWPLFRRRTARSAPVLLLCANVALENRD